jgi:hypothetical protein
LRVLLLAPLHMDHIEYAFVFEHVTFPVIGFRPYNYSQA